MDHWIALDRLTDVLVGATWYQSMKDIIRTFKDGKGNILEINITQKTAKLSIGAIKYTEFDQITATENYGLKARSIDPWTKFNEIKNHKAVNPPNYQYLGLVVEESEDGFEFWKKATLTITLPDYGESIFTFYTTKHGVKKNSA
jgi:hypothetical protein